MKREIPFEVPAGSTVELECTLEARGPGAFQSQLTLYLDDLGLRETAITVQGSAR